MTEQRMNDFEELVASVKFISNRITKLISYTLDLEYYEGKIKDRDVPTMLARATISMQEAIYQLERAKTEIQLAYEEEDNDPQIQL